MEFIHLLNLFKSIKAWSLMQIPASSNRNTNPRFLCTEYTAEVFAYITAINSKDLPLCSHAGPPSATKDVMVVTTLWGTLSSTIPYKIILLHMVLQLIRTEDTTKGTILDTRPLIDTPNSQDYMFLSQLANTNPLGMH